ncbi:hypothetical protein CC2G_008851 [Coprinopsis cinerea AmutBmut pab1-1]|nr:hypothetical protein CC2G_008851 [Coprinopsis cinerea AmutBmut pab1-1]
MRSGQGRGGKMSGVSSPEKKPGYRSHPRAQGLRRGGSSQFHYPGKASPRVVRGEPGLDCCGPPPSAMKTLHTEMGWNKSMHFDGCRSDDSGETCWGTILSEFLHGMNYDGPERRTSKISALKPQQGVPRVGLGKALVDGYFDEPIIKHPS